MNILDKFLSKFTLYQLTLYYLIGIILAAFLYSFSGKIPFNPFDILLSTSVILFVGISANSILAGIFNARSKIESVYITLLILTLIIPIKFPADLLFAALAAILAIASKYLLTIEKRHIFNPAALSVVAIAILYPDMGATWWIGTPIILPFVLIGGLLLIRKIRGGNFILTFIATYLGAIAISTLLHSGSLSDIFKVWQLSVNQSALLFFAFVMLTEPLTSPANKKKRLYFAVLVALLYSTIQLRISGISFTPEIALCIGNIFTYLVRPRKIIPERNNNIQSKPLNTIVHTNYPPTQ
jgi:Na+-transporting NADH:ubiquinone oxidoreductase subunit NqrB